MENQNKQPISLFHAFGSAVGKGYYNCIALIQENKREKILFPVGRYLAKKSLIDNDMTFVKFHKNQNNNTQTIQQIYSIAINPKRTEIAFAQKTTNTLNIQVSIYSLFQDKIKVLRPIIDMKANSIKFMTFSPTDKRVIVCISGQPQNYLIYLDVEQRHRALAVSTINLKDASRLTVNPIYSSITCVTGKGYVKIFKMEEHQIKILIQTFLKLPKNRTFTEHTWLDKSSLAVSTSIGQIYILTMAGEVRQSIDNAFRQSQPISISLIRTFSKGIIIGSHTGKFAMWVKIQNQQGGEMYIFENKWACIKERKSSVVYIDFTIKQDMMVVGFGNNDIATIGMNQIKPGSSLVQKGKDQNVHLDYIYKGFHTNEVSIIDTCIQRPLIVTSSKIDSTVRIWNYIKPNCELIRLFSFKLKETMVEDKAQKPILSLAMHPSGYYLAVGSPDKTRIYHILFAQLRFYQQLLLKGTYLLKFSKGGDILVAVYPRPKSTVSQLSIYSSYTLQSLYLVTIGNISKISLHQSTILYFQQNTIFSLSLKTFAISSNKLDCKITDIAVYNKDKIYVSHEQGISCGQEYIQTIGIIHIVIGNEGLYAATKDGFIKYYTLPLYKQNYNIPLYFCQITTIILSTCQEFLITGSQEGTIFILNTNKKPQKIRSQNDLSQIVLLNKLEIQDFIKTQKQLRNSLEDLQNRLDFVSQDEKRRTDKQKQDLKIKLQGQIEQLSKRFQFLKKQKRDIEAQNQNLLKKQAKTHIKAIQQLQTLYEHKLAYQNQKYMQLQNQLMNLKISNQKNSDQIQTRHQKNLEILKEEFRSNLGKAEEVMNKTKQQALILQQKYRKKLQFIQKDYQEQIMQMDGNSRDQINRLKIQLGRTKQENQVYRTKQKLQQQQYNKINKKNQKLQQVKKNLQKQVQDGKSKLQAKSRQLKDKDEVIKMKERKLRQAQIQIADLKKSKHVLSYRTTQMRMALQPKDQQIEALKQQLYKLQTQFQQMIKANKTLQTKLSTIIKSNQSLCNKIKQNEITMNKKDEKVNTIVTDIHNIVKNMEVKQYAKQMGILYQKYVLKNDIKSNDDKKGATEMERHMSYLQKSIKQVNQSTQKIIQRRTREIYKKTKENAQLIYDLNQIRKQHKIFLAMEDKKKKAQTTQTLSKNKYCSTKKIEMQQKDSKIQTSNAFQRAQSAKSAIKTTGKLFKGSMFDPNAILAFQKTKVNQLQSQLQQAGNLNQILRQRIRNHVINNNCNIDEFQDIVNDFD